MELRIEDLSVALAGEDILTKIDLDIRSGEFISLLGASGCGKSTLLKSIAGLLEVRSGDIRMDGASVIQVPPEQRGAVIVFQDLRLFPHMNVEENIAFPMELKGIPKDVRRKRVEELLQAVQLPGFRRRRIREMSGGQQQRVALARALAADPKILLLDEPFSGLDPNLRSEMGRLVRSIHEEMHLTTVMVTHDREEAMRFSDRIALMESGRILQYGTPDELWTAPESREVADLMGTTIYFPGTVEKGVFRCADFRADLTGKKEPGKETPADGPADLMLHPSELRAESPEGGAESGAGRFYAVRAVFPEGETVEISLSPERESGRKDREAPADFEIRMIRQEWEKTGLGPEDRCILRPRSGAGVLFRS